MFCSAWDIQITWSQTFHYKLIVPLPWFIIQKKSCLWSAISMTGWLVNNELERMWKEWSWPNQMCQFLGGNEKPQSGYLVSGLRFEPRTSQARIAQSVLLQATGRMATIRFSAETGIFLFSTASRLALGPTQLPIQWVPWAVPLGVMQPGHEADHSPPFLDTSSWHSA
jgi:hypothetical protein